MPWSAARARQDGVRDWCIGAEISGCGGSWFRFGDFAAGEDELREFLAARMWSSLEGPRTLFNRAVVWLIGSQVLLPGITTLAPIVAEVRREENDRLYATMYRAPTNCAPRWAGGWRCRRNAGSRSRSGCGLDRCASRAGRCSTPRSAPRRCGMVPAGLTA